MQSMTGYGYASAYRDERELAVEIRTVNHRFLDLNIRMPRSLLSMEDVVRKQVSAALSRGHVDITVTYQNHREDASFVELNVSLLSQYVHAVEEMVVHYLPDETDLPPASYYASIPGVLTEKNSPEDEEAVTGWKSPPKKHRRSMPNSWRPESRHWGYRCRRTGWPRK